MEFGRLVVRAYLAEDALPVEGALVRVLGVDEGVSGEEHLRFTDMDGVTDAILLPAPPRELSEHPSPREAPYATYRVSVAKEGYFTKVVDGVAVFDGVTTILPVNMILKEDGATAPVDTLKTFSTEPERLV